MCTALRVTGGRTVCTATTDADGRTSYHTERRCLAHTAWRYCEPTGQPLVRSRQVRGAFQGWAVRLQSGVSGATRSYAGQRRCYALKR